jgi:hypothetical protein
MFPSTIQNKKEIIVLILFAMISSVFFVWSYLKQEELKTETTVLKNHLLAQSKILQEQEVLINELSMKSNSVGSETVVTSDFFLANSLFVGALLVSCAIGITYLCFNTPNKMLLNDLLSAHTKFIVSSQKEVLTNSGDSIATITQQQVNTLSNVDLKVDGLANLNLKDNMVALNKLLLDLNVKMAELSLKLNSAETAALNSNSTITDVILTGQNLTDVVTAGGPF